MQKKNLSILGFATASAIVSISFSSAQAASLTYDPITAPYDHTEAAPVGVANDAPAGFESGSFAAPGIGPKTEIYFTADSLFGVGNNVTIPQIKSISFNTKNSTGQTGSSVDWFITAYTALQGSGNDASFYHHALTFEDTYARNVTAPANTWNKFASDSATNQLTVSDHKRGAFGTATDPTLADIQSGPVDWSTFNSAYSSGSFDYTSDVISYFDLSTGSAWAAGFTGQIDGITVSWDNGSGLQTSTVNLEAVTPEPASIGLITVTAAGLLMRRRRHHA